MKLRFLFLLGISFILINKANSQNSGDLKPKKITAQELTTWDFYGAGSVSTSGEQLVLKEDDITKGVMIISPNKYPNDVIIKYKALALTPATVIVTMFSMSDTENSTNLNVPDEYDGNIGLWFNDKTNYFVAFKNAPHNVTPFVRKNPLSEGHLASAAENKMIAGVYYQIEIGKRNGKIWLSINDEKAFETTDVNPLGEGHIAVRIRGTGGFKAGCLIKDFEIYQ